MADERKGVKGQIKHHKRRTASAGLPSRGPITIRDDDGDLVYKRCRSCKAECLVPAKTDHVQCGRCVQYTMYNKEIEELL